MDASGGDLRLYYDRLYPFAALERWLSYGRPARLARRELAFTSERDGRQLFMRWRPAAGARDAVLRLAAEAGPPAKFDIGAVYDMPVALKAGATKLTAVERELVLDIDMDEYDDIRVCCKEKRVCRRCWQFLGLAMEVLDAALREDFGFRHILWVFSGRRGIHCWVCDRAARRLPAAARAALVSYLSVFSARPAAGAEGAGRSVRFPGASAEHPFVVRSYDLAFPTFLRLVREHQILRRGSPGAVRLDAAMKEAPRKIAKKYSDCVAAWDGTSSELWRCVTEAAGVDGRGIALLQEIAFAACFPRLDVAVTKDLGHLLKAPFCVHPSTGSVCVPIPFQDRFSFDPTTAVKLASLADAVRRDQPLDERFAQAISTFESFVDQVCAADSNADAPADENLLFPPYFYPTDKDAGKIDHIKLVEPAASSG